MNDVLNIEVCEFYSIPRIAPRAIGKYVSKSASFDINTNDTNGEPWNFMKSSIRQKAREYVKNNKPMFIIGSPPCDQWSIMQNLNNNKRDPEDIKRKLIEARIHLSFCAELYRMQIDAGRYYLHENPTSAKSWEEPCIREIMQHSDNFTTRVHMCAYNMKIPDKKWKLIHI